MAFKVKTSFEGTEAYITETDYLDSDREYFEKLGCAETKREAYVKFIEMLDQVRESAVEQLGKLKR